MDKAFVGIDISQDRLDVFLLPHGKRKHFSNMPQGVDALKKWLSRYSPERIVIEPTGKLEYLLVFELSEFKVSLVNPRHARDFARAKGRLEKTDGVDAEVLAEYGRALMPPLTPPPTKEQVAIKELVARRRQLIDMRVAEKNRFKRTLTPEVKKSISALIDELSRQIEDVDEKINSAYKSSEEWQRKVELLESIPGVAQKTATNLLALLPELGNLSQKQIAKLVGVAPLNRDSGMMRGKRTIKGGRASVRETLYMSAMVGARFNPRLKPFYKTLRQKGKTGKVALVACMRKLVIIMNSMLKYNQPFCPAEV